jgi:hypothetical protein
MTMQGDVPALSIGAVLGDADAENMSWKRAINALSKQVQAIREGVTSPVRLNVVYHVDGKLVPNEFEGVRTGRFDQRAVHLMVQAAVPVGPVEDRQAVLLSLLQDAVLEAERFAQKKGLADELAAIRAVVRRLT